MKMISNQQSSGFHKTPVSKFFLGTAIGTSVLLNFPLKQHQLYFIYTHNQVFDRFQFWRILSSKLAYLDLKDLFLCSVLIYNFRVFERRLGSRKFCEYLLGTGLLATVLELLSVYACRLGELPVGPLPTGPLCMIYPLFVRYYCDIPRVPLSHVWGIPMTGKSLAYILGLQVASSSPGSMMVAACGIVSYKWRVWCKTMETIVKQRAFAPQEQMLLYFTKISGILWQANFLKLQKVVQVPGFISRLFQCTLGRLLDSTASIEQNNTNVGATLEIQRQEAMERLEQQVLWQSIQNSQRHLHIGRPQPQNVAVGPGIFGIGNNNAPEAERRRSQDGDDAVTEVSEEQVQRLVEMGFNQEQVRHALQVSNNDISMATNFLLQQS